MEVIPGQKVILRGDVAQKIRKTEKEKFLSVNEEHLFLEQLFFLSSAAADRTEVQESSTEHGEGNEGAQGKTSR